MSGFFITRASGDGFVIAQTPATLNICCLSGLNALDLRILGLSGGMPHCCSEMRSEQGEREMKKVEWFLLLMLFASVTNAAETVRNLNTYVGAGVGTSKDEILDKFYNETVASGKLFAGLSYNTYSGIEASYAYLGSFANNQITEEAVALNLVAFAPVSESISIVAKAGMYYYRLNASSATSYDSEVTYGLGLKYNLDYRNAIRGEWELYKNLGGSDVDMYSISYSYRFGRP